MTAPATVPRVDDLAVGDTVAQRIIHLTRESLVRYAGASGDFNPIHYRDDVAAEAGLPGVLAHGMLTMGLAVAPVVDWLGGDGSRIVAYSTRFTRPVVVHPTDGADLDVVAKVGAIDGTRARIDLTVSAEGRTVLGRAQVQVELR